MVLRVVARYRIDRFAQASPCATGDPSRCERHPRWQAGGKAPVSGRLENPPSSSIVGRPRHRDLRLPCAVGIVLPALKFHDSPRLLSTQRSPPAKPLGPPPRLEHIAGAATLVPWLTTAPIRRPLRPSPFSPLPNCLPLLHPPDISPLPPT